VQAPVIKSALQRIAFERKVAERLPPLGEGEGGSFKEQLAEALALGGAPPGTPPQEEDAVLRRALERAGLAGGAIIEQALEQALRPLLNKGLAGGYSRPLHDSVLELSQAEGSRIDLAALFELAAAARPVAAEAGTGASPAQAAEGAHPAAAQPPEEAAEGGMATRVVAALPAGLEAAVEGRAARAQEEPRASAGPRADHQLASGAQGRPSTEAAAGRGGAVSPGLELARVIHEVLSATVGRAESSQRRGQAHFVAAGGGSPSDGPEPFVAGGQVTRTGAGGTPEAVIEQQGLPEQPGLAAGGRGLAGRPLREAVSGAGRRREAGEDLEVRAAADKLSAPGAIERPSPGSEPSPEAVRQVANQVERAITAGLDRGEERLRLRLKPPGLGELRLDLSLRSQHLKVVLVAETSAARDILQAALPELRHSLAEQGLMLEQFSVFVRHEGGFSQGLLRWDQGTGGTPAAEVSVQAGGPEAGAVLPAGRVDLFC
jgi:hypothetical protein